MASSDEGWITRVENIRGDGGLAGTIEKVLLLPVVAFFLQLANALEAILNVVIVPTQALAAGIGDFLGSLFGGVAQVLSAGAAGSAQNVQEWFVLSFPVAMGVVIAVAMIMAWYTDQNYTSDLIPFTSTDIPLIGNDEESE